MQYMGCSKFPGQLEANGEMKVYAPEDVAVVSVNYKKAELALRVIEALLRLDDAPGSIVIADNGSGAKDVALLQEGWTSLAHLYKRLPPAICREGGPFPSEGDVLLVLENNKGFSGGNNAALHRLISERKDCLLFWLLNSDAFPQNGALAALCECAARSGLAGSTLVYAAEPARVQCAGGGTVSACTGTTRFIAGKAELADVMRLNPEEVEKKLGYINGASLLIRREVLEKTGLLPEEYFLYYEDVDWCTAALRAGFRLGWARESLVLHMEGASCERDEFMSRPAAKPRAVDYYSIRNRIWITMYIHYFSPLFF